MPRIANPVSPVRLWIAPPNTLSRKKPSQNCEGFFVLVRETGIEPVHPYGYKILSLGRLPIPPPALEWQMLTDRVMLQQNAAHWASILWPFFVLVGAKFRAYNGLQIFVFLAANRRDTFNATQFS